MSAYASTSAMRLLCCRAGSSSSHQSLSYAQRRTISCSSVRLFEGKGASPARAKRVGTDADRSEGGPDLDPMSATPRNSSTEASSSAKSRGAQALADLAQGLRGTGAVTSSSTTHFDLSEAGNAELHASEASRLAAPSGYSKDVLPVQIDPTLEAFVNNLMKDGKKASATRYVIEMMDFLSKVLNANPLPAIQSAISAASPLVRMQSRKSGGKNVAVPLALNPQQSRRRGIIAIIEASKKRSDERISIRLAKEILAVLEGHSSTLAKKEEMHRLAMVNRSNASVRI